MYTNQRGVHIVLIIQMVYSHLGFTHPYSIHAM